MGVTPRAALASPAPVAAPSREEVMVPRLRRNILRAAAADPRLALAVVDRKEEAERATAAAQAAGARELFKERGRNERQRASIEAQNARASAAARLRGEERATDLRFRTAEEARRQAEFEQQINPDVRVVQVEGTDYVVPFAGNKAMGTVPMHKAPSIDMVQMPDTSLFYPTVDGKPDLARPFERSDMTLPVPQLQLPMMPNIPRPQSITVPGAGPLKPATKATAPKPNKPHNFGTTDMPDWREWDAETGVWRKVRYAEDLEGQTQGQGARPAGSKESADQALKRLAGTKG